MLNGFYCHISFSITSKQKRLIKIILLIFTNDSAIIIPESLQNKLPHVANSPAVIARTNIFKQFLTTKVSTTHF